MESGSSVEVSSETPQVNKNANQPVRGRPVSG